MNKATSVQSFTYLGLVVSEKNVPKKLTNLTLWGYGLQSPLNLVHDLPKHFMENPVIQKIFHPICLS